MNPEARFDSIILPFLKPPIPHGHYFVAPFLCFMPIIEDPGEIFWHFEQLTSSHHSLLPPLIKRPEILWGRLAFFEALSDFIAIFAGRPGYLYRRPEPHPDILKIA